jgi:hypothetical protein
MSVTDNAGDVVVGSVKINHPVTQQFVDDILVTAFEGGINYWCSSVYPVGNTFPDGATYTSDCLSRGRNIVVVEDDDGESKSHILTLENLIYGIKCFAALHKNVNFFEDFDACDADCIVQYAVFGDIVYG